MSDFVDYLIIGGGIAGATAAEAIRQRDPRGSIRVIGAERHPLYSRVLLPHVADGRASEGRVVIKTADAFAAKGIEYVSGAAVVSVDAAAQRAGMADGSVCAYGKLLVASGSSARRFDGPGEEHCLYFRTLDDLRMLTSTTRVGTALVYGGGFNAIDLAVSLARRGARVTCAMRGDGFLARALDVRSRGAIKAALERHGITVLPHMELRAVERKSGGLVALLSDGKSVNCDLAGVSVGVTPNVGFLAGSGVPVSTGVIVDDRLRASDHVYAAGDVAEYLDPNVAVHRVAGNWMNAMFQGKVAGANMAGDDKIFDMVTSYSIACFELPVSFMGAVADGDDERVVRDAGETVMRFFLRRGRVIGVTCAGPFSERSAVSRLLSSRVPLSERSRQALGDPKISLSSIVS
ncbi:MAG: hypothetical protein RL272_363 [Candidatus Parcubacteria bacterium]|jgi:NAD(P)H-nitrite reductase large subunit